MESVAKAKKIGFKKFLSKKPVKIIIGVLLVAIIGLIIYNSSYVQKKLSSNSTTVQRTANVKKGDIKVTVSGSGAVYYVQSQETVSKVDGIVKKVYFKEGDKVKAGDLLAELDDSDQQSKVQDASSSLAQTELSNNSAYEDLENLTIKAPFSGQVTGISVSSGDTVNKGAAILTITDTSKLKVTLPFNAADVKLIKTGTAADVNIASLMQVVKGTVTYVSSQPAVSSNGTLLYNVEIQISNPGALTENMVASADISTTKGTISSIDSGKLSYINKTTITSKVSGNVESVSVKEHQQVKSGTTMVKLQSDEVEKSIRTASLNIANSQKQVSTAQEKLEYYKIYAPFDGSIISQTINVGDSVKAGGVIAKVADTSQLAFNVSIDELDVSQIKVGQEVTVSLDAFSDTSTTPMKGAVSKIAMEGTSTNGVTSYNVTIKISGTDEKIKSGMNANGEILVSNTTDVLYVPIEAIQKINNKSFVYVKSDGTQGSGTNTQGQSNIPQGQSENTANSNGEVKGNASGNNASGNSSNSNIQRRNTNSSNGNTSWNPNGNNSSSSSQSSSNRTSSSKTSSSSTNNYYANAVLKEVEVGVYNDSYIEIKSGLNERDTVILPQIQSSSSTNSSKTQSGIGGFGGMGGGVQGGPPSGSAGGGKN
ncbi:multidrug resistance protein MdtA [Clostridium homopropionicum DSM 5847]|uniref:Multidrug resistance protein MdtA n=1 Tax=Clostridium homopropionicum DSM 5847 TaxID=1121318 RepID=A0A0L6ZC93_9CLOT|nr:efflux RND transporter periplasmic adaptor subunit [Clostridium homopropionicum]KOA20604.1 multidrug resistance protein MdtA [Clostridium homopropionicum DSM 5847]SFF93361.1 HlyD family secretion protein [Clostridium homopropionicum]